MGFSVWSAHTTIHALREEGKQRMVSPAVEDDRRLDRDPAAINSRARSCDTGSTPFAIDGF